MAHWYTNHRLRSDAARVARFSLVGALGTAVYYSILWGLVELARAPVLLATSIAFIVVCAENYALHYLWTFASSNKHSIAVPRFMFMNLIGFLINTGVMFVGVHWFRMNYLLIQAFSLIAVMSWNFALSSYWVFRSSHGVTSRA